MWFRPTPNNLATGVGSALYTLSVEAGISSVFAALSRSLADSPQAEMISLRLERTGDQHV